MGVVPVWGIVFPASMLDSEWFAVLSAFVAINTLIYTVLAIGKILPKIYLSDLLEGRDRRVANRSIHPTEQERVEAARASRNGTNVSGNGGA
jgi:hypothetical protein